MWVEQYGTGSDCESAKTQTVVASFAPTGLSPKAQRCRFGYVGYEAVGALAKNDDINEFSHSLYSDRPQMNVP